MSALHAEALEKERAASREELAAATEEAAKLRAFCQQLLAERDVQQLQHPPQQRAPEERERNVVVQGDNYPDFDLTEERGKFLERHASTTVVRAQPGGAIVTARTRKEWCSVRCTCTRG